MFQPTSHASEGAATGDVLAVQAVASIEAPATRELGPESHATPAHLDAKDDLRVRSNVAFSNVVLPVQMHDI